MRRATMHTLYLVAGLFGVETGGWAQQPSSSGGSRVALQVLAGGLGAAAGTVALAMLGSGLEPDCSCDDPGLVGAVIGAFASTALGSATAVYAVGRAGPRKGSFGATVAGGFMGMGLFLPVALSGALDPDHAPFWVAFWALPTAGAVAWYHSSAKAAALEPVDVPPERAQLSVAPTWHPGRGPGLRATISF